MTPARKYNSYLLGLGFSILILPLSACAGGGAAYEPIVDSPRDAKFQQDLSECQMLAEQKRYNNSDVRTGTAVGAGLGGISGVLHRGDDLENGLIGAAVGAVYGGGGAALGTRTQRKNIVMRCMSGRGHRVLG